MMIRLSLTQQEAEQLHRYLSNAIRDGPSAAEDLAEIVAKLILAREMATCQSECPVCKKPFVQSTTGRPGQYCSNACKQKAYRQRRNTWRRQYRPRS